MMLQPFKRSNRNSNSDLRKRKKKIKTAIFNAKYSSEIETVYIQYKHIEYEHLEIQDLCQPWIGQQPCSELDAIEKLYLWF